MHVGDSFSTVEVVRYSEGDNISTVILLFQVVQGKSPK